MARQLQNITMHHKGDPEAPNPCILFFSYDVVDGALRKRHQVYEVEAPNWEDTPNAMWAAGIAQIKINEGIN